MAVTMREWTTQAEVNRYWGRGGSSNQTYYDGLRIWGNRGTGEWNREFALTNPYAEFFYTDNYHFDAYRSPHVRKLDFPSSKNIIKDLTSGAWDANHNFDASRSWDSYVSSIGRRDFNARGRWFHPNNSLDINATYAVIPTQSGFGEKTDPNWPEVYYNGMWWLRDTEFIQKTGGPIPIYEHDIDNNNADIIMEFDTGSLTSSWTHMFTVVPVQRYDSRTTQDPPNQGGAGEDIWNMWTALYCYMRYDGGLRIGWRGAFRGAQEGRHYWGRGNRDTESDFYGWIRRYNGGINPDYNLANGDWLAFINFSHSLSIKPIGTKWVMRREVP